MPIPENDQDNADLLITHHQDDIRYSTDTKAWYVWQSNKWVEDTEALIVTNYWIDLARNTIPSTIQTDKGTKANTHYKYSLNVSGQEATVRAARKSHSIQTTQASFDSHPYELNTPKGIVDLKTCRLTAPDPTHHHTKETRYTPEFTKQPYKWLAFLKQTFEENQELIDYMQRLMGVALIGEVVEQLMPFAFGPSGTGKSTFFETVSEIMGNYAEAKSSELLMRGTDSRRSIASVHGTRMIFMSELNEGSRFDEARLKLLTGNDTLEGAHIYQRSFTFKPTHTLFLFGNSKPRVTESGNGVWRRLKLLPFINENTIRKNGELKNILIAEEGPQILAWMIRGAKDYINEGRLLDCQAVTQFTKEYEDEEDILGQFIDEHCLIADNALVKCSTFKQQFDAWCDLNGYKAYSSRTLTMKLKSNKKYGNIDNNYRKANARYLTGITLTNDHERIPLT